MTAARPIHFISFVGNQVVSVLNSVLSLAESGRRVDRVTLLATPGDRGTREEAEETKAYLEGESVFKGITIKVQDCGIDLASTRAAFSAALDEASAVPCLNLAGGMNWQVAATARLLADRDAWVIYPEYRKVNLARLSRGCLKERIDLPLPRELDVLSIQGVKVEPLPTGPVPPLLKQILERYRDEIRLPRGLRRGFIIDGVEFVYFWNLGNSLRLVTVIEGYSDAALDQARRLNGLATQRTACARLYHKAILLVANNPLVIDRARDEATNKITVVTVKRDGSVSPADREIARTFFDEVRRAREVVRPLPERAVSDPALGEAGRWLFLMAAPNVAPTLNAIAAHEPTHLGLCYTKGVRIVSQFVKDFVANGPRNNRALKKVVPITVTLFGAEILDLASRDAGGRVEVNVSPGTKSQGFFLALAAARNGWASFSHDTRRRAMASLDAERGDAYPERVVDPVLILRAAGIRLLAQGEDEGKLHFSWCPLFREFLAAMGRLNRNLPSLRNLPIDAEGWTWIPTRAGYASIRDPYGREKSLSLMQDLWFEQYVGWWLLQAGAERVRIRMRTRWNADVERSLREKGHRRPHRTDLDVVAGIGARYYVVSCKSGTRDVPGSEYRKLLADVALVGNFSVPILARLHHDGPPRLREDGICVIGAQTLALGPEESRAFLDKTVSRRQTTA